MRLLPYDFRIVSLLLLACLIAVGNGISEDDNPRLHDLVVSSFEAKENHHYRGQNVNNNNIVNDNNNNNNGIIFSTTTSTWNIHRGRRGGGGREMITNDAAVAVVAGAPKRRIIPRKMKRRRRRVQEADDITTFASLSVVPSTAPSEVSSFDNTVMTTTATTTTTSLSINNNVNNATTTSDVDTDTYAPSDDSNNGDIVNNADAMTELNMTSSLRTIVPSLSPQNDINSWEIMTTTNSSSYPSNALGDVGNEVYENTILASPSPSPSQSRLGNVDVGGEVDNGGNEEEEGTEELGEPLIRDGSNVPTPSSEYNKDINDWNDDEFENSSSSSSNNNNGDDYYEQQDSFVPTPSTMYYNNGNDDFYAAEETIWEELYTAPPTMAYVPPPSDEDPLIEDSEEVEMEGSSTGNGGGKENSYGNENKYSDGDDVPYHGLGGKVGTFLDTIESPSEMQNDKNVQVVTGTLISLFVVTLLLTAHLVMYHPDGLCAGCCRLALSVIGCVGRTICLPCRAVGCCPSSLGSGSEQRRSRRSHAPMRTPFPTDLELT